jgi:hypothetical protein
MECIADSRREPFFRVNVELGKYGRINLLNAEGTNKDECGER